LALAKTYQMKSELLEIIHQKISEKIQKLEQLIAETRASNNDTKSSMGDKYETSREMLQQEINNLQIQLNEHLKSQQILKNINPNPHKIVTLGSLVETEKGMFFIAISLGELSFNQEKIFVISAESPLAKAMNGKKTGESFVVNNLSQIIKNIW
jgi:transcription elongation GreA/GreB family factor